jgi:hypothetical protein
MLTAIGPYRNLDWQFLFIRLSGNQTTIAVPKPGALSMARRTEPGTLEAFGKAVVCLPERLDGLPDVLRRHSNARVFNLQAQSVLLLGCGESGTGLQLTNTAIISSHGCRIRSKR